MNALVKKLLSFADKDYRDGYMQTRVRAGIAYQMQALRRKFGLSQSEMATRTGKTQSVISRLENTEYGKVSVQTLLDVASSLDVALLVQFVSYPEFLTRSADMADKALQPDTIYQSLEASSLYKKPIQVGGIGLVSEPETQPNLLSMPQRRPLNFDDRPINATLQ